MVLAHKEIIEQMALVTSDGWGSLVCSVNRNSSKCNLCRIIQNFTNRMSVFWDVSRSILGFHQTHGLVKNVH